MSPGTGHLRDAVQQAQKSGDAIPPTALIDTLASIENPIAALLRPDQANTLFEAFNRDFGFVSSSRNRANSIQPPDLSKWASLLRWLILELKEWCRADDPVDRKLVAIFVVTQASDFEDELWSLLPPETGDNPELIQRLKGLLASFSAAIGTRGGADAPIWEREAADRFAAADAAGDWVTIRQGLRLFEHQLLPSALIVQAVRCLHWCGMHHLVEAVANLHQTVVTMHIVGVLPVKQRLRLASASDNPYVQFSCVCHILSSIHGVRKQLLPDEQTLLTTLLLKVAVDEPRWNAWMQAFNSHPVQGAALQSALGQALADAPDSAVNAYVNAISLGAQAANVANPDPGRQLIAECLRAFGARAAPSRRALLWGRAHERWLTWAFDKANANGHLSGIHWSILDYAVVAFAAECMNEPERVQMMDKIRDELRVLDDRWHNSIAEIVTEWNRLLSQFQPYARASRTAASNEDWFTQIETYLPFDPSNSQYLTLKYRAV